MIELVRLGVETIAGVAYSITAMVVAALWAPIAFLWDVQTGVLKRTLVGHEAKVLSVVFSPDGKTLVSGSGAVHILESDRDFEYSSWCRCIRSWRRVPPSLRT